MKQRTVISAPFGYKLTRDIWSDDEKAVLELCLDLVDNDDYKKAVLNDTHKNRLNALKQNGFRFTKITGGKK